MAEGAREILASGAAEMGILLTDSQLDSFDAFTGLLTEWNRKLNLTRITEPADIAVRHYLDSLSLLRTVEIAPESQVIDVGTGAGLPGVPLKIARPDLRLTMLDSVRKKLTFVEAALRELALSDVELLHARAEELGRDSRYRERFDVAVSRAVARLSVLAELCLPFCRIGGVFAAYKGPDVEDELLEAERAVRTLGGGAAEAHAVSLPHSDARHTLVIVGKRSRTPPQYPRKAGVPERKAL